MQQEAGTAPIRDLNDLSRFLTRARRLSRVLNSVLAEDSLREDLWRIMHAVSQSHGMLMGEIADTLALPPATTTRLIDELSDHGIVFRRPAPDDGRKAVVYLSRLGQERLDRVEALLRARLIEPETVASAGQEA